MLRSRRESLVSRPILFLLFLGTQLYCQADAEEETKGRKMFCYYSSSSQLRQDAGKFLPENIDPSLCTHVIFAFADLVKGTTLQPGSVKDLDKGSEPGLYNRTLSLRRFNPSLRVLLAVGGWRAASAPFVEMVRSTDKRRTFLRNVVRYLRQHGFDGLDVDWEFPGTRGSEPGDKILYTGLLKDIREAFVREAEETGNRKLLLTVAVSGGSYYINLAYEPKKIVRYVDYLLIMAYNYHGSWNDYTGHHSALYPRSDEVGGEREWNQAWSLDFWLNEAEAPRSKVILGLATYGMTFTLSDPDKHAMKAAASGAGSPGRYTQESGTLGYYEICENLKNGWTDEWEEEQKVPFAHNKDQWVGYDNPRSLTLKVEHLIEKGIGGAFIWSLDMDDFQGTCGNGKYPLLSAIVKALNQGALSTAESDVVVGSYSERDEDDPGHSEDRTRTDQTVHSVRGRDRARHGSHAASREARQGLQLSEERYSDRDADKEESSFGGRATASGGGKRREYISSNDDDDKPLDDARPVSHLNPRSLPEKAEQRNRKAYDDVTDYESRAGRRRSESTGSPRRLAHTEEAQEFDGGSDDRPDRLGGHDRRKVSWFDGRARSSLRQRSRSSHDFEPREATKEGAPAPTADGSSIETETCSRSGVFPDPESCRP